MKFNKFSKIMAMTTIIGMSMLYVNAKDEES